MNFNKFRHVWSFQLLIFFIAQISWKEIECQYLYGPRERFQPRHFIRNQRQTHRDIIRPLNSQQFNRKQVLSHNGPLFRQAPPRHTNSHHSLPPPPNGSPHQLHHQANIRHEFSRTQSINSPPENLSNRNQAFVQKETSQSVTTKPTTDDPRQYSSYRRIHNKPRARDQFTSKNEKRPAAPFPFLPFIPIPDNSREVDVEKEAIELLKNKNDDRVTITKETKIYNPTTDVPKQQRVSLSYSRISHGKPFLQEHTTKGLEEIEDYKTDKPNLLPITITTAVPPTSTNESSRPKLFYFLTTTENSKLNSDEIEIRNLKNKSLEIDDESNESFVNTTIPELAVPQNKTNINLTENLNNIPVSPARIAALQRNQRPSLGGIQFPSIDANPFALGGFTNGIPNLPPINLNNGFQSLPLPFAQPANLGTGEVSSPFGNLGLNYLNLLSSLGGVGLNPQSQTSPFGLPQTQTGSVIGGLPSFGAIPGLGLGGIGGAELSRIPTLGFPQAKPSIGSTKSQSAATLPVAPQVKTQSDQNTSPLASVAAKAALAPEPPAVVPSLAAVSPSLAKSETSL